MLATNDFDKEICTLWLLFVGVRNVTRLLYEGYRPNRPPIYSQRWDVVEVSLYGWFSSTDGPSRNQYGDLLTGLLWEMCHQGGGRGGDVRRIRTSTSPYLD